MGIWQWHFDNGTVKTTHVSGAIGSQVGREETDNQVILRSQHSNFLRSEKFRQVSFHPPK